MLRPAASLFTGTGTGRSSALSSRSTAPNRSGGLWQTPSPRPRWKYDSVPAKKTWSRLNFSNAAWNRYSGTAAQPGAFAATRKVKQNWPESRWRNTSCSRKRHPGRLGRCVPRLRPFCHRPCGTPAWAGEPGREAARKDCPTMRSLVQQNIDAALAGAYTLRSLWQRLEQMGYTGKHGANVKPIAVKPPGGPAFHAV